jgi:hypothetical protein
MSIDGIVNGIIVPGFDIGAGPSSCIYTLENSVDGSWFVGGSFYIRISKSGKVSKIDADGLLDIGYLTPGVGFDNSVYKVVPLAGNNDGFWKLYSF